MSARFDITIVVKAMVRADASPNPLLRAKKKIAATAANTTAP
jgi:hypothetical protein